MNKRSIYSLILTSLLFPLAAIGQSTLPPNTQLPDIKMQPGVPGSSGSKSVGNIEAPSLYDGSYNLAIPFYSYSNDYGQYGVSITYNTKGVPVRAISSVCGLNWHLMAGGSIERQIKDVPDETFINIYHSLGGDPPLPALGKLTMSLNGDTLREGTAFEYPTSSYPQNVDGEHDDFIFNVRGGLSFTFNIGKGGFIFTHPKQYAKIEILLDGLPLTNIEADMSSEALLFTFRVTDEQGVVYHFTPGQINKWAIVWGASAEVRKDYVARWNLSKITFPNGQEITYRYSQKPIEAASIVARTSAAKEGDGSFAPVRSQFETAPDATSAYANVDRLDTIIYPNGVLVNFKYRQFPSGQKRCDFPGGDILDTIMVLTRTSNLKYYFDYSYQKSAPYNANYVSTVSPCESLSGIPAGYKQSDYIRMFLMKIWMKDQDMSDGSLVDQAHYTFEYDTLRLPPRWSGSRDFYGYYNAKTVTEYNGRFDIPIHQNMRSSGDVYGVDRSYNPTAVKAGLLKSFQNAFGGKVSFTYEGHTGLTNHLTGPTGLLGQNESDGLRVKYITRTDPYSPGSEYITEYLYSGGQRFLPGGNNYIPDKVDMTTGVIKTFLYMADYVSPFHLVNGSNHGYSMVTEIYKNQDNEMISKKETTFTNFSDATSGSTPRYLRVGGQKGYWEMPYADRQYIKDWEMGLPLEIAEYDKNGRIVSRMKNTYTFTLDTVTSLNKVSNKKVMLVNGTDNYSPRDRFDSVIYRPYTGKALLAQSLIQKYISDASFISDTIKYEYDSRNNVAKVITRNSNGKAISLEYLYNYNVSGTKPAALAAFPDHLSLPLGMERWLLPATSGGSAFLLESVINRFDYNAGKIKLQALYKTRIGDPLPDITHTGYTYNTPSFTTNRYNALKQVYSNTTPANFKEISRVSAYDAKGNVLTTEMLDDEIFSANLWDSISGYKLAEVSNAENKDIAFAGFDHAMAVGMVYTEFTDYASGNFIMTMGGVKNGGICGKYYALDLPMYDPVLTSRPLTPGKKYVLQLWSMGGAPSVTGGGLGTVTFTEQYAVGTWKNYIAYITPTTTAPIVIKKGTSAANAVDEVRLHPADSEMASYTYDPLHGIRGSSDAKGRLTLTEYDQYGRATVIRDQEGKIISQYEYGVRK